MENEISTKKIAMIGGGIVIALITLLAFIFSIATVPAGHVGIVTNFGAGLTQERVDHAAVTHQMREQLPRLRELLLCAAGKVITLNAGSGF